MWPVVRAPRAAGSRWAASGASRAVASSVGKNPYASSSSACASDALPLLAYLLQELYFAAGRGKVATFEGYSRLGGVAGALSRQADQVVTALRDEQGIEPILAVLFDSLPPRAPRSLVDVCCSPQRSGGSWTRSSKLDCWSPTAINSGDSRLTQGHGRHLDGAGGLSARGGWSGRRSRCPWCREAGHRTDRALH